jgi:SAM-dependent MidA family methyltransferase
MKETNLIDIIVEEIKSFGPISFSRYMELCLYHKNFGYYRQLKPPIGRSGDYYTSPCVHKIFGHILGKSLIEVMNKLDNEKLCIVEAGAGNGYLIRDMGEYFSKNTPHLLEKIKFYIIEPHQPYREMQKKELKKYFHNFEFVDTPEELKSFTGIFYSNELFDSMPVEIIQSDDNGKLSQVYVNFENNNFVEVLLDPDENVINFIKKHNIKIPTNFRVEIPINAATFYNAIAQKIEKGAIFTIDYGYPRKELLNISHNRGTLMCYYRHTALENPYIRPGKQDITCHIDFTLLKEIGESFGFKTTGFVEQYYFLMGTGIIEEIEKLKNDSYDEYEREIIKIKNFLLPGGIGDVFKVLYQVKGINYTPKGFSIKNRVNNL